MHQRHAPRLAWNQIRFFWGDERDVPAGHPDSNYGMAAAALLTHVPVDARLVHPIPADGRDAQAAARAYDVTLQQTVFASRTEWAFDLTLLGIGSDAHIASLFPADPPPGRRPGRVAYGLGGRWSSARRAALEMRAVVMRMAMTLAIASA